MKNTVLVDILLPTYNGEKYLGEQIESIISQTYSNWRLVIRDDGSWDSTISMIESYQQKLKEKLIVVKDQKHNLGVCNNVFELLKYASAPYVMLADQDDVWFPNKVEFLLKKIYKAERQYQNTPILVHAEGITTNEDMVPLTGKKITPLQGSKLSRREIIPYRKSLIGYASGYKKERNEYNRLLFQNVIQGASMIINRALIGKLEVLFLKKLPQKQYHDSIIASIASIEGKIIFCARPLMFYRQHTKNLVGTKRVTLWKWNKLNESEREQWKSTHFIKVNSVKCELLLKYYREDMDARKKRCTEYFLKNKVGLCGIIRNQLWEDFTKEEIGLLLLCKYI